MFDSSNPHLDPDGNGKFAIVCGPNAVFDNPVWPKAIECLVLNSYY